MIQGKVRTIIIDDERALVDSLQELVVAYGVDVVGTGTNGKEAVELYKILKPDFVILDIIMDEYDGFYAIKEIRKIDPAAKFIVMSSFDSKKAYDDLMNLGIMALIRKPVTPEKIEELLSQFN